MNAHDFILGVRRRHSHIRVSLNMETKSPWSTPTESEILNAEDSALIKEKEAALFEEIDYTVNDWSK